MAPPGMSRVGALVALFAFGAWGGLCASCGGRIGEIASNADGGPNAAANSGTPCNARLPCGAGLVCRVVNGNGAICGTCVPAPVLGASCQNDEGGTLPCGPDLYCVVQGDNDGTCVAVIAGSLGASCTPSPPSEPSSSYTTCAPNLVCNRGQCTAPASVEENGACETDAVCATEMFCDPSSNACAKALSDGAPCDSDAWCEPALRCQNGKCISSIAAGSSCDPSDTNSADPAREGCGPAFDCDPRSNTCATPEPVFPGDSCNAAFACSSGADDCVNGVCLAPASIGAACTDDVQCPATYACANGTCQIGAALCSP